MKPTLLRVLLFTLVASIGCTRQMNNVPTPLPGQKDSAQVQRYTIIRVNPKTDSIRLFLLDDDGHPFNRFDRLTSWLEGRNKQLQWAMNAGMYEKDYSPVGLLVLDGREVSPLNLSDGSGNFFNKPNGVFFIGDSGPRIVESSEYPAMAKGVRLATQSGPLLVRNGVIHPAFSPLATSRWVRNGVGISGDTVLFLISEQPVNIYEFASYFCDTLNCRNALYLDGAVSGLYSRELNRNDFRADLGPIVGVVK